MNIVILICTFNEGINRVKEVLLDYREDIHYVVSHQITNSDYNYIPLELKREDVTVFHIESKGLSLNRNACFTRAKGDICFIADDDVKYTYQYIDTVKDIFLKDSSLDVCIGKIKTDTNVDYKSYGSYSRAIKKWNVTKISSIEIVVKRSSVLRFNIIFDIRFGLGSSLFAYGGEEAVFIMDCLNVGMNVRYYPVYISQHPFESSGKLVRHDNEFIQYHAALMKRLYGRFSLLLMGIVYLKNYWKYISPFLFAKNFLIGYNKI